MFSILLAAIVIISGCGDSTVNNGAISSLTISPTGGTVRIGSSLTFTVTGNFTDGTTVAVIPSWALTNNLGTITAVGYTGLFNPTATGTEIITASYSGQAVSATVIISEALPPTSELAAIEISPNSQTVRINALITFNAYGTTSSGEGLAFSPVWSLTGDSIGTLTANGTIATLEAKSQGTAVVHCTSGEIDGIANVTVSGYAVEITAESDSYVDSSLPTASYESVASLKGGLLTPPGTNYEAYFHFSLASLPSNITIQSATIKTYAVTVGTPALQTYLLSGAFSSDTTWNTKPSVGTFLLSSTFTASQYNSLSSDAILTAVKSWYSTPATNYGIAIKQDGSENGVVSILSRENGANPPVLSVEYTNN
ncbi:MAG: DNRLRE domain-containing protein [Candidatus Margulisiibacteriota bacterium]